MRNVSSRHGWLSCLLVCGWLACGQANPPEDDTASASDTRSPDTSAPKDTADDVKRTIPEDTFVVTVDTAPSTEDALVRRGDSAGAFDVETSDPGPPPAPGVTPWGEVSGACGSFADFLSTPGAALIQNTYTFTDGESFDPGPLAPGPKKRYEGENAGGSSICSEVMSMQLLIDCEGGVVLKTENEIAYATEGAKTDYVITIAGQHVGVSVTRAYLGPFVETYTQEDAVTLLTKKLKGVNESAQNVSADDAWSRSVLHVWTLHPAWAETLVSAWDTLEPALKASTLVMVTVEAGGDLIVTDACD